MKRLIILATILALLVPVTVYAQKKRVVKKIKIEVPTEDPKVTKMLAATAQLTIIDSVVIDSIRFLSAINFNPEEGAVTTTAKFFKNNDIEGYAYLNELGTKCIFSRMGSDGHTHLYQRDKLADQWSDSEELKGLTDNGNLTDLSHPYLMPDGITLYFSAKGAESLGGYDIYRTRYDAENGKFLKPENIGMPFNSEADDFMFVIDEQNRLGYFASNRRQPQGKTCVYTFIPLDTRKVLNSETTSAEKIRSLARIDHIADTWGDGVARKKALIRLSNAIKTRNNVMKQYGDSEQFRFVINDKTTYTSLDQFRNAANRNRMKDLLSMRKQAEVLQTSLIKARTYYATASNYERQQLRKEILKSEQQQEQLQEEILRLEKTIRNNENL